MSWQDIVITGGQFVFIIALVPTIKSTQKPAFLTSSLNGVMLIMLGLVYFTLGLWLAAITTITTAFMWLVLAAQAYKLKKVSTKSV